MLMDENGKKEMNITAVLLTGDRLYHLDDDQFLQFTPNGKKLELWEGKKELLNDESFGYQRVCAWLRKSVIAFY